MARHQRQSRQALEPLHRGGNSTVRDAYDGLDAAGRAYLNENLWRIAPQPPREQRNAAQEAAAEPVKPLGRDLSKEEAMAVWKGEMRAWVGFLEREKLQWGPKSIARMVLVKSGGFGGDEGVGIEGWAGSSTEGGHRVDDLGQEGSEGGRHNSVSASTQALGYGMGVEESKVNEEKGKGKEVEGKGKGKEGEGKGKGKEVEGKGNEIAEKGKGKGKELVGKGNETNGKAKEVDGKGNEMEERGNDAEGIEKFGEEDLIDLWGPEDIGGNQSIGWSLSSLNLGENKEVRPL